MFAQSAADREGWGSPAALLGVSGTEAGLIQPVALSHLFARSIFMKIEAIAVRWRPATL